ncbi:hypothetical protein HK098_007084 [Nowakowskiella sp. JEL0407]|nr:hypothetical protein HK098_007084 [Nowakowskiella sp. JEL0407]
MKDLKSTIISEPQDIEIQTSLSKGASAIISGSSLSPTVDLLPPPYSNDENLITPLNSLPRENNRWGRTPARIIIQTSRGDFSVATTIALKVAEIVVICVVAAALPTVVQRMDVGISVVSEVVVVVPDVADGSRLCLFRSLSLLPCALDASAEPVQIYAFEGSKYVQTILDFKTHGVPVKSNLKITKSNNSTGFISLRMRTLGNIPKPSQTFSDDGRFRLDSSDYGLPFLSYFSAQPSCMAAIAEIALPVGTHEYLAIGNSNGPISFDNLADAVYNNVVIASDNGEVVIKNSFPAKLAEITVNNGDVTISDVESPELNLKVSSNNGGVSIANFRSSGLNVESRNGKIQTSSLNVSNFTLKSNNGKTIVDGWAGRSITTTSDNGPVDITIPTLSDKVTASIYSKSGLVQLSLSTNFTGKFDLQSSSKAEITGSGANDVKYSINETKRKIGSKTATDLGSAIKIQTQNGDVLLKFI